MTPSTSLPLIALTHRDVMHEPCSIILYGKRVNVVNTTLIATPSPQPSHPLNPRHRQQQQKIKVWKKKKKNSSRPSLLMAMDASRGARRHTTLRSPPVVLQQNFKAYGRNAQIRARLFFVDNSGKRPCLDGRLD